MHLISDKDSLYGSRHLAEKWLNTGLTDEERGLKQCKKANHLQRIDVMILLDLIGASNMYFIKFSPNSTHLYTKLMNIGIKYRIQMQTLMWSPSSLCPCSFNHISQSDKL